MKEFEIIGDTLAIGDPVMGLAHVKLNAMQAGGYHLGKEAIVSSRRSKTAVRDAPRLSLDGPYLYVLDASKEAQFLALFHEYGKKCNYNMMRMEMQHMDLERALGAKVGFYWVEELSGKNGEGEYVLDIRKIQPNH